MGANLIQRCHTAKALDLLRHALALKLSVCARDTLKFFSRQLLLLARTRNQRSHLAPVNEQYLTLPLTIPALPASVFRQKPQRTRNLRVCEKLPRQLHHSINVTTLDQSLPHCESRRLTVRQ